MLIVSPGCVGYSIGGDWDWMSGFCYWVTLRLSAIKQWLYGAGEGVAVAVAMKK